MALSYGFYNSVDGDRTYDAIQFGQIFDGIIKDGVYGTYLKGMVVIASENAGEVIIQPGRAWFNHTWSYNDANLVMQAPAPEVLLDRIDALVLDIASDLASRENSFKWVTGEPSSNPRRPTLINTVTHHQYPLCYVRRYPETTMIYERDITNMVGTSECPFATGVLEGIDLDAWIRQWDDEFHTWEDATKVSFEGWMVTQQEVYTTWYNAIKSQMEGDLTDFEDWFERIQGIIDEEAATHLQSEIDALAAMLPAGSHITISTSETSLYLRNVTVNDGVHEATAKFDNSGVAVVESFPYVGLLTITSTDGQFTASTTLNTPYFGRYSASLSFWGATVNLDGDETLGGYTVTVKNSLDTPVISIVLNASGKGVFNATYPDTYKFVWTYGGDEMQVSLNVTEEKTYSVEIYAGFNWRRWCELGGVSTYGMTSLQDVFNDEQATRKLMTVHASADYLIDRVSHNINDLNEFTVNDTAMKWLGLRDYVCDGLTAINGVWAKLLASSYWERILKDHVPIMTSNTAPYGTASATSVYSTNDYYQPYRAFRGTWDGTGGSGNCWQSGSTTTNQRIVYKSTNPICVKSFEIMNTTSAEGSPKTVKLQGSNDGTNWEDISEVITCDTTASKRTRYTVENDDYYLYTGLMCLTNNGGSVININTLQFYGRSLNVSVPTMTSNTAPYGEASESSVYNSKYAYYAFDNTDITNTSNTANTNDLTGWIQYEFTSEVCVKFVAAHAMTGTSLRLNNYEIVASNDGVTFDPIYTGLNTSEYAYIPFNNDKAYKIWRLHNLSGANNFGLYYLQFYGVDYTEREFASGSTMKYLYDHGLELVNLGDPILSTSGTGNKDDERLFISVSGKGSVAFAPTNPVDFGGLSVMRFVFGDELYSSTTYDIVGLGVKANRTFTPSDITMLAVAYYKTGINPNSNGLDIENISNTAYPMFETYTTSQSDIYKATITEWWLE